MFSDFELSRYPHTRDPNLRAYSAADEYLLWQLNQQPWRGDLMIVNDAFGALTVAAKNHRCLYWNDSYLAMRALHLNIRNNAIEHPALQHLALVATRQGLILSPEPAQRLQQVIMRIPKHLSMLQMQLQILKPYLADKASIIAAGMCKEIHRSTIDAFSLIIGPTSTSLARKKARLIISQNEPSHTIETNFCAFKDVSLSELGLNLRVLPGVFSRDKLDIGTRVLLNHLPRLTAGRWLDLGCGSGVIGCFLQQKYPDAKLVFSDESQVAVLSARESYRGLFAHRDAEFHHTDGTLNLNGTFDAVFCNPPFHQNNAQNISLGKRMIVNSAKVLRPGGTLFLVANRHLPYARLLRQKFASVRPLSRDPKFIVWQACKA